MKPTKQQSLKAGAQPDEKTADVSHAARVGSQKVHDVQQIQNDMQKDADDISAAIVRILGEDDPTHALQ